MDDVRIAPGKTFNVEGDLDANLIVERRAKAVVSGSVRGKVVTVGRAEIGGDVGGHVVVGRGGQVTIGGNVFGDLTCVDNTVVMGDVRGNATVGRGATTIGGHVTGRIASKGKLSIGWLND